MFLQIPLIGSLKGDCKSKVTFLSKQNGAGIGLLWYTEILIWHTVSASRTPAEGKH